MTFFINSDEIALIETKDAKWLEKRILMEKRKIERLRNSCTIIEVNRNISRNSIKALQFSRFLFLMLF